MLDRFLTFSAFGPVSRCQKNNLPHNASGLLVSRTNEELGVEDVIKWTQINSFKSYKKLCFKWRVKVWVTLYAHFPNLSMRVDIPCWESNWSVYGTVGAHFLQKVLFCSREICLDEKEQGHLGARSAKTKTLSNVQYGRLIMCFKVWLFRELQNWRVAKAITAIWSKGPWEEISGIEHLQQVLVQPLFIGLQGDGSHHHLSQSTPL